MLHYYDDEKKSQCHGCFAVEDMKLFSCHISDNHRDYCWGFSLGGGKTTVLAAPDLSTKQMWLAALAPTKKFPHNTEPLYQGYLLKQGSFLNMWKKRYFELYETDVELRYYNEKKGDALGSYYFTIESGLVRFKKETHDRDFAFGITQFVNGDGGLSKDLVLAASTAPEHRKWLASLVRVLNRLVQAPEANSNEMPEAISDFGKLLELEAGIESFRAYLAREYATENLSFYLAVGEYIKNCDFMEENVGADGKVQAFEIAMIVFNDYIADGAKDEVNLPSAVRSKISLLLGQPDATDPKAKKEVATEIPSLEVLRHVYDDARDQIFKLMQSDSYRRYASSDLVCDYILF